MKKIISFIIVTAVIFSCFSVCSFAKSECNFDVLKFPDEAVTDFDSSVLSRPCSSNGNRGYSETGTYISPYWNCRINASDIPVYSALTYDYANDYGVLHSYSHIWIDLSQENATVNLSFLGGKIKSAKVLPSRYNVECKIINNDIRFTVSEYGIYTVLINDETAKYAFTLYVEKYTNEDEEITKYQELYGEENVFVFDKDFYEKDNIVLNNYKVIYFCRGSYFMANHIENNSTQRTFLMISGQENLIVDGCATFDFNACDSREADSCFINSCKNCEISGLNFVNSSLWTMYTYACENLTIKNVSSIGYRINSDGINICNSKNVTVKDSFIRTGDDSFSVKTMNSEFPCENVLFENCAAWSTKARCFGITGEVEADISNITFRNCVVIDRPAAWDNNRLGSLCVIVENGNGTIDGITFENIEINHDDGRAINCTICGENVTDSQVKNIQFKNITYNAEMKSQICSSSRMKFFQKISSFFLKILKAFGIENKITDKLIEHIGNNNISVTFENVQANGKKLTFFNKVFNIKVMGNVDVIIEKSPAD